MILISLFYHIKNGQSGEKLLRGNKKRVFDDLDILDEDTRSSGGASCISLDCHP